MPNPNEIEVIRLNAQKGTRKMLKTIERVLGLTPEQVFAIGLTKLRQDAQAYAASKKSIPQKIVDTTRRIIGLNGKTIDPE